MGLVQRAFPRPVNLDGAEGWRHSAMVLHGLEWPFVTGVLVAIGATAMAAVAVQQSQSRELAVVLAAIAVSPCWLDMAGARLSRLAGVAITLPAAFALAHTARFPSASVARFLGVLSVGEVASIGSVL